MYALREIKGWLLTVARSPGLSGRRWRSFFRALRWKFAISRGYKRALVSVGPAKFYCYPGYSSASGVVCYGLLEWHESAFIVRFLRPGDFFVDIGANIGTISAVAGSYVPGVEMVSVEPDDDARRQLIANLELNGLPTGRVIGKAVGETVGEVKFTTGRDVKNSIATQDSQETVTLEQTTVDEIADGRPITLLKIDVEGAELAVFKGAVDQLTASPGPVILYEQIGFSSAFGVDPGEINRYLLDAGYELFEYDGVANELVEYVDEGLPTSSNLIATKDVSLVRDRISNAELPVDLHRLPISMQLERSGA